jgi:hypothetical protein
VSKIFTADAAFEIICSIGQFITAVVKPAPVKASENDFNELKIFYKYMNFSPLITKNAYEVFSISRRLLFLL